MDTSYFNWARGNRVTNYAGLVMAPGTEYKYGPDYTYMDVPAVGFYDEKEEKLTDKGLRNQYLKIVPACTLDVKGTFKVLVEPCLGAAAYGMMQAGYLIHSGSGVTVPDFYILLRKDLDIKELSYAVRLYLVG